MKYTCPHCGEKTFTPVQKALCGGLSSAGKRCSACGGRCVNGKASLILNITLRMIAFIMIIVTYFVHTTSVQILWFGVLPLVLSFVIGFVFDMFFGKLVEAVKHE